MGLVTDRKGKTQNKKEIKKLFNLTRNFFIEKRASCCYYKNFKFQDLDHYTLQTPNYFDYNYNSIAAIFILIAIQLIHNFEYENCQLQV